MENTAILVSAVTGFAVTAISGKFLIPFLKKLKFGQTILDIGPKWHKSKEGTPTMGGLMFILGTVLAAIIGIIVLTAALSKTESVESFGEFFSKNIQLFAGLIAALGFASVGFVDDYIKIAKRRNLGLTAIQKIIIQVLIAASYILVMSLNGKITTMVKIPFLVNIDFGIFYSPLAILMILFVTNAVNLTDGVDGLCSCVTFVVSAFMTAISMILGYPHLSILAAAAAGSLLGFLLYNFHPAKVFMGDTGSMFLGGLIIAYVFGINEPLIVVLLGIVYIVEAATVIIQVIYFKATKGKRLFKMTPIHHHFEMSKWSEIKIVMVFSLVTIVGCGLGILSIY